MRKLFRFKYEPCKGTCYAWCDFLPSNLLKMTEGDRQLTVSRMVAAHGHLCDNPDFSFGVDLDEPSGMFVGYFRSPASTETFIGKSLFEVVEKVSAAVLAEDIPAVAGTCNFGGQGSEDLGSEILRACTDAAFREEHHQGCPCVKEVI